MKPSCSRLGRAPWGSRRLRRCASWLFVAVVTAGTAATASAAGMPPPDQDPFYAVPPGIARLANGTVLRSRVVQVRADGTLPMLASAWQVKYKTLGTNGRPTADVATIMVPDTPWSGPGPRPLVSYQTFEDAVGSQYSPSYVLDGGLGDGGAAASGWADTDPMFVALRQGWAVVAPDYEGPRSEFLGAAGEAHGVLDGVRATLRFRPDGLGSRTPVALWGYSGGSVASVEAAMWQPRYAPRMHFAGIALGGLVTNLKDTAGDFAKAGLGGAIIVGLVGIDRAYPELHISRYLTPRAITDMAKSQSDGVAIAAARYPGLQMNQIFVHINSPGATAILRHVSPLWMRGTPTAPIYDYHGTSDELAPISDDRLMMHRFCRTGVTVDHVETPGEHFSTAADDVPGTINWLAARFEGQPAPNDCPTIPAG